MLEEKNKIKILLSVLFLALVVRLSVFSTVFSRGGITFLGADTYYEVRRIIFTVSYFPNTLNFDLYVDFPYGNRVGWMPLYDQFVALIALIAGFGNPSPDTIEATIAIVPPLLGVLTVLLVFFITENLFDWRVGIISAGIFAITPAHVYVSFLGYADHHVAETLLSTAAYLFFIIALKRLQKQNISLDSKTNLSKNLFFPIFTGIILAMSILTWNGAPIFVGVIGIFIFVQFVLDKTSGRNSDYLVITGGIAYFISFLIITPVALINGMGFEYNSYSPSLFHAGFLTAFFFLCVILALIQRMKFKKWWYYPLLLILTFEVALYSLGYFYPEFYLSAKNGIGYLFGEGISMVQEAAPLFSDPGAGFTLDNEWNGFTISFFIALLSLIYLVKKTVKEKYNFEFVFLIVWTLIVLTLTVLQRHFMYLLAVNVAILSAYFITIIVRFLSLNPDKKTLITKKKRKAKITSNVTPNKGLIVGLLILVLLAFPNLIIIKSMATDDISAPPSDKQESFKWLKDNSPPTSYYDSPDKTAEYSIMSWWENGNWILYFSRRPVVANNLQAGMKDAARYLVESDEKIANKILDERKVRYVITDASNLKGEFPTLASIAGKIPNDYYGTLDEDVQVRSVDQENKNFFATMLSRLHVFDGNELNHYRLIYESKTTAIKSPDIKYVKIFEYVPGVTISGKTSIDGDIKVTLDIMTNRGRTFVYTQKTIAKNGRYEIILPYSTLGGKYETNPLDNYKIQNANNSVVVSVSEEDVLEGRKLQVDL